MKYIITYSALFIYAFRCQQKKLWSHHSYFCYARKSTPRSSSLLLRCAKTNNEVIIPHFAQKYFVYATLIQVFCTWNTCNFHIYCSLITSISANVSLIPAFKMKKSSKISFRHPNTGVKVKNEHIIHHNIQSQKYVCSAHSLFSRT